ncbi:MAG: DnaD domain protein [Clostridia bacterium]|nr:DnaD domain protein [Clostridia bacterium]
MSLKEDVGMAIVRFDEGIGMNDSTPVDNLFISEYMLRAPGDYVKVYLYSLMLCHHPRERQSVEALAKDLGMEADVVDKAFRYWMREGLVRKVGDNPPVYAILTATQLAFTLAMNPGERLYNRRFTEEVQRVLGDQVPSFSELQIIYDWVDVMELPEEVVIMLLQNERKSSKSGRISFQIANIRAKEWANAGVRTVEDVEKMIILGKEREKELKRLLSRLGQRREASFDEKELYRKWVDDWGFTPEAIQEACKETTKGTPTMAYLDGILLRQHQMGWHDVKAINMGMSAQRTIRDLAKQVLQGLGRGGSIPSDDDLSYIIAWQDKGYEDAFIMYAVRAVHRRLNHAGFDEVDNQLTRWVEKGLDSALAVQLEAQKTREKNTLLRQIFEKAGVDKQRPSESDRNLLDRFTGEYGMDAQLIMLAAEYAAGRPSPLDTMNLILKEWHAQGVRDLEAARAEHAGHVAKSSTGAQSESGGMKNSFMHHTDEEWARTASAAVVDLDGEE